MTIHCDYCHRPAQLVTGKEIYPHRPDLFHKWFWNCEPCGAYVGCHEKGAYIKTSSGERLTSDGTMPFGRLANAELRKAKSVAHSSFDAVWKSGRMKRNEAYAWLSKELQVSQDNCHIGMFNIEQCQAVIAAVRNLR